jgi:hypothetical protein
MKKCSCIINDKFDFRIEYKDKYLLFIDKSIWGTSEFNSPLEEFDLKIINGSLIKTIKARINGATRIDYCDLPSNNGCGNDGIYQFQVDSCGDIFTICEAILININCAYTKLLLKYPMEEYKEKVWPIFREIEFIKANASICNTTQAIKHYEVVKKMFEHINCKC